MNKIPMLEKFAAQSLVEHDGELIFSKEKFAELIVEECCNRLGKETIRHDGYGYNQHELYRRLREHFGVAE